MSVSAELTRFWTIHIRCSRRSSTAALTSGRMPLAHSCISHNSATNVPDRPTPALKHMTEDFKNQQPDKPPNTLDRIRGLNPVEALFFLFFLKYEFLRGDGDGLKSQRSHLQCTTAGPRRGMASKCCRTCSVKAQSEDTFLGMPRSGQAG